MANKPKRETQTLDYLVSYHIDVVESLRGYLHQLYQESDKRFIGYNLSQYQEEVAERLAETDLRSSLALLTAVEALLREDYAIRVGERREDTLSKAFLELSQLRTKRIRFDEDLLELWSKHHPELRQIISQLRAAAHFRNWLAHGRYWQRPGNDKFDYASLYDLANAILQYFPLQTFEEAKL